VKQLRVTSVEYRSQILDCIRYLRPDGYAMGKNNQMKNKATARKKKKDETVGQDVVAGAFDGVLCDGEDGHALPGSEEPHDTRKYRGKVVRD